MKNTQDIIKDYIRCAKTYLIVNENPCAFFLWKPFVQGSDFQPIEVLRHRADNEAINYFLSILQSGEGKPSDSSRFQYDIVYRFNNLVDKSKESFTDAYLSNTLDELKIVNISEKANDAIYKVLFPRERILWKVRDVEQMRRYVADHYKRLSLGKQLFEEDIFEKERLRIGRFSLAQVYSNLSDQSKDVFSEPIIRLNMDTADISLAYGEKEASISLQTLPKAWLIYFITHDSPLLYSEIKSDRSTLNKYYELCLSLSKERRGRNRKEDSSLKPGLVVRKINAELSRCCTAVGLLPGTVSIVRMGLLPPGSRQVDEPKMLLVAKIEIEFPKEK